MSLRKLALFGVLPLFAAGAVLAQTMPGHDMMHKPDMAAMHKEMCSDHAAHTAAHLAYIESKLELTDAQKPLFVKLRQAELDAASKHKAACLAMTPKADAMPTILDHEAHEEAMLKAKLETLQATRPALQALYDSLTPAQKQVLDTAHEHHFGMMDDHHGMGGEHMHMMEHHEN